MIDTSEGTVAVRAAIRMLQALLNEPTEINIKPDSINPDSSSGVKGRPASNIVDFHKPDAPPANLVVPDPPKVPPSSPLVQSSPIQQGAVIKSQPPTQPTTDWSLLDKFGMPWDSRIHQSGKATKKTGEWKLQKGIEEKQPGLVQVVTAENAAARASGSSPVQLPLSDVPPPPVLKDVPPPPPLASEIAPAALAAELSRFGHSPLPEGASVPNVPEVPVPPVGTDGNDMPTFRSLVKKVTAATKAGTLTAVKLNELCQASGAPNMQSLNSMTHLVPVVDAAVDLHLAGLG